MTTMGGGVEKERFEVAIIGAGPSGLVAAKEAFENGLEPTILEQGDGVGGVWRNTVWPIMRTNLSKFTTVFGDTPYPPHTEIFPDSGKVLCYLNDYVDQWGLRKAIKLDTKVMKVCPVRGEGDAGNNGWEVTWKSKEGANTTTKRFGGVVVATGIFSNAAFPSEIDISSFSGKVIHSKEYKNGGALKNLTVAVIGGSFSGAEIAGDVAGHSKKCYHIFRKPFWILNRYLPSSSLDKRIPIDLLFYNRKFYSNPSPTDVRSKNTNMSKLCKEQQDESLCPSLHIPPTEFDKPINAVISDTYLSQVRSRSLVPICGEVEKVEDSGRSITTKQGTDQLQLHDVDVIIFATGFHTDLSFFPEEILSVLNYAPKDTLQPLILFQECIHPSLPNLFFVGMYKGPYFAVMEMQARWAARTMARKIPLPPLAEMQEGLEGEKRIRGKKYDQVRPQFPHPDYVQFADSIATHAHSFPNLDKLRNPQLPLKESLGLATTTTTMEDVVKRLEGRKEEIATRFMNDPVTPSHYNVCQDPVKTLENMQSMEKLLSEI